MAQIAITIEGGLVSGDLLERIAADPEKVEGQRPADFGVDRRLSEEIQGAFSDATTYWHAFEAGLHEHRRLPRTRETTSNFNRRPPTLIRQLRSPAKLHRCAPPQKRLPTAGRRW